MNKPNEVGGGGGGRAERMPAVGKPFTSGAGWVLNLCWVSEGSLWSGGAALSPYTHTHNVPAAHSLCQGLLCHTWQSRTGYCRMCRVCSHQQGTSKLTEYCTSSTWHSSELLHQTITWLPYFAIALSLCPQGSQVSIGNSAMESWFCQRSYSRAPQAGRQHSGPTGKKQMDRKPTCSPKLFKSKMLLCCGSVKAI